MKKYAYILLSILIVLQLAVPAYMIAEKHDILQSGKEFRFRVMPVDPYDAFRGRYVAINFGQRSQSIENFMPKNGKIYAIIETGEDGFSTVASGSIQKPTNADYLFAKYQYGQIRLPFDRYYMDEKLAPKAETTYRAERRDAYVVLKVKNGKGVIEGLYINDERIEDYVKNLKE